MIPITRVYKVKTVTKNSDGKDETKETERTDTVYSHSSWLEEANLHRILDISYSQTYKTRSAGVVTAIGALLATVHIPLLNKLPVLYKAAGIVGSATIAYFGAHFALSKVTGKEITKIVSENDLIPVWNNKERVMEKSSVYFFLDDDKGFRPNILYHGISEKQIDSTLPDGVYGNTKYQSKSHLDKYNQFISNKDQNLTSSLLEELGLTKRAKAASLHH